MDESHRYRASAGVRAINELKPILGLRTDRQRPCVRDRQRAQTRLRMWFTDYATARAIADGFVKDPAVATRAETSVPQA